MLHSTDRLTSGRRDAPRAALAASAIVVALGLSACAGNATGGGGDIEIGPGPGNYAMDLGGYTGVEPSGDDMTITIMRQSWDDASNAVFDETVAEFEAAYPNITVSQQLVPYGDLSTNLQTYVASGNVPDIVMGRSDFVSSYLYGDIAAPVGEYFTDDFLADFTPSIIDSVTLDGVAYALPWEHQLQLLAYNIDMFEEAGVPLPPQSTDPEAGWTVDQWFDAFAQLRAWMDSSGNGDLYPLAPSGFGNGGPGSNYAQLESTWIRMQGSPDADPDSDEYRSFVGVSDDGLSVDGYINNPLAVEGMTSYQSLFTNNWSPVDYVPDMFKAQTAAVDVGGIFAGTDEFDWGLTPLPRDESVVSSNASDSFIVSSTSEHPAEAAALLGALTSTDTKVAWHTAWGSLPAQQSVIAGLPAETTGTERYQMVQNMAAATVGAPQTPGWFEYFNQMNTTVRDIGLGADPQTALDAAAVSIDNALSRYAQ
ncbi:extracellular solute-binding protein [Agromyces sp. SYSU T00194]|uniref:extracellular solute-binding protein n=1 Tax=Agromyces chitinivorans TaxID=3158560 RepID=UPI003392766A